MRSVELFSGCGGLALGLARAGFEHLMLVERDAPSVRNMEHNRARGVEHVASGGLLVRHHAVNPPSMTELEPVM